MNDDEGCGCCAVLFVLLVLWISGAVRVSIEIGAHAAAVAPVGSLR